MENTEHEYVVKSSVYSTEINKLVSIMVHVHLLSAAAAFGVACPGSIRVVPLRVLH